MRLPAAISTVLVLASCLLNPLVASADTWGSTADSQGNVGLQGFVDQPKPGSTVLRGSAFTVSGWVVDPTAQGWSGVDAVQLYWGNSGPDGKLIANARVGLSRPDVAEATGSAYWNTAGFAVDVSGWDFQPGDNLFTVYAHTAGRGWWSLPFKLTVVAIDPQTAAKDCAYWRDFIDSLTRSGVRASDATFRQLRDACTAAGINPIALSQPRVSSSPTGSGNVVALTSSHCDYFVVKSNTSDYAVLEWFGGPTPSRGDQLAGSWATYGFATINDLTQGSSMRVWIDDYDLSESRAVQLFNQRCP